LTSVHCKRPPIRERWIARALHRSIVGRTRAFAMSGVGRDPRILRVGLRAPGMETPRIPDPGRLTAKA
jgi:hypothetical protein